MCWHAPFRPGLSRSSGSTPRAGLDGHIKARSPGPLRSTLTAESPVARWPHEVSGLHGQARGDPGRSCGQSPLPSARLPSRGRRHRDPRPDRDARGNHLVLTWRDAARRPGTLHRRSEEHTSELQSRPHLVCRLLLEKKKKKKKNKTKKKKKKKKKQKKKK